MTIAWILVWLTCGLVAVDIGKAKSRAALDSFILGAVIGPLGVLLVAVLPAPTPEAMRTVMCPRCHAQQKTRTKDQAFECWRCKKTSVSAVRHAETYH